MNRSALALAIAALAVVVPAAPASASGLLGILPLAAAGPTGNGAPFLKGQVHDKRGNPYPGPVSVTAMPRDVKEGEALPVVATGIAGAAGDFVANVTDLEAIKRISAAQDGWLEVITASDGAESASGGITVIHVDQYPSGEVTFTPQRVQDGQQARPLDADPIPAVDLGVDLGASRATAAAKPAIPRACDVTPLWKNQSTERRDAWTLVGELNNAYNDGTSATFTYGTGAERATTLGLAVDLNGAGFSIEGETHASNAASVKFPTANRRFARKLRTKFEYLKTVDTRTCPQTKVTDTRTTIRAVHWLTGADISVKQAGALDKCQRRGGFPPDAGFVRETGRGTRWTEGAHVYGASITAQTAFTKTVSVSYSFGGKKGKKHYLCGQDGKQSPAEAGRIYSGAKPRR